MTNQRTGHRIEIAFGIRGDSGARALHLAGEILQQWAEQFAAITLLPSSGERFDVMLDGELIFSEVRLGRHAQPGEINATLEARLGPAPGFGS